MVSDLKDPRRADCYMVQGVLDPTNPVPVSAVMSLVPNDFMMVHDFECNLIQKYHTLTFNGALPPKRVDQLAKEIMEC